MMYVILLIMTAIVITHREMWYLQAESFMIYSDHQLSLNTRMEISRAGKLICKLSTSIYVDNKNKILGVHYKQNT